MRFLSLCISLFLMIHLLSCTGDVVMDNDPKLTIGLESIYFYEGQKFSGILKAVHPNGIVRLTTFKDGLEHGRTIDTFPNGILAAEYFYDKGKYVGIHKAWYESGQPRFLFAYNAEGQPQGDHWEWHEDGKVYRYTRYEKGVTVGTKIWRKDGKIYANYTYTPERLYGVVGSKLCFKLKGDETNKKTVINP